MSLIYGVGINDVYSQNPSIKGSRRKKDYMAWMNMLERCYSPLYHAKKPTYRGVTVCEEWHRFSNFKRWYDEHYVEGWHLDKDLLTDSREYGPSTCIFVPGWLNKFLTDCGAARGDLPIGVSIHKPMMVFRARCNNQLSKKYEHLGLFPTPEEAYRAWLNRKVEIAYQLKDLMDAIDRRIYFRVVEIIFAK